MNICNKVSLVRNPYLISPKLICVKSKGEPLAVMRKTAKVLPSRDPFLAFAVPQTHSKLDIFPDGCGKLVLRCNLTHHWLSLLVMT